MATHEILIQVCTEKSKSYDKLCKYLDNPRGSFKWVSRLKEVEHKQRKSNPGDYDTTIDLEQTSNEVVIARVRGSNPGIVGAFVAVCIRCFGGDLLAVDLQFK